MTNQILLYVFAASAVVMALWGYLRRPQRLPLWFGAIGAAGAAAAASADSFWPMILLTAIALWGFVMGLKFVDLGLRARLGLVLWVVGLGFVALWPSLDSMTGGKIPCPAWVKQRVGFELVAGLDLRGGLRLVYTVDADEAINDRRDRYYEEMRSELAKIYGLQEGDDRPTEAIIEELRKHVTIEAPSDSTDEIRIAVLKGTDPSKIDPRFLQLFSGDLSFSRSADQRKIVFRMRDSAESSIRERAVNQAREIILRRVDELGLREASVSTRDEDIIVEVPGEDEKSFDTIRDIISQTARLEFKLLDDSTDFFKPYADRVAAGDTEGFPQGLEFPQETAPVGLDENGDVETNRVYYAYLPKEKDEESQATLARLKAWAEELTAPPDRELGFSLVRDRDESTFKEFEAGWRTFLLKSRAEVTGDMIRDAAAVPDQGQSSMGGWHVALTFTDQGGNIFEQITGDNVKRRFAIILDDRIESAPVIQTKIPGGHASITMGSSDPQAQLEDSKQLELVLRSGALPAPISPSNEQRIGPSLGRDSIRLGVQSALVGGALVLIFMLLYYRRAGLIANLAVTLNLFLQLAILASFGASMTLPGIAGLALTIGMSVDSNVLINERIREELRSGKTARAAVELGYNRAVSAIVDGHLTTLISGVVLAQYGSGPIKGFAVTLIVGVLTSIFTGIIVSRVFFDLWVRTAGRDAKLDVG